MPDADTEVQTPTAADTISVPVESETPPETPPETPEEPQLKTSEGFTAEDLAKARKEEKDKLYGRIEEMQGELRSFREAEEARKQAEEEAEARRIAEAEKKAEEEMEVRELLTKKEQEWQDRFQRLEQEREQERALLEKEREFSMLTDYRRNRLDAEADHIMPELRDLVQGNTQEEIDASIATMIERTSRILDQVRASATQARQQMPGVKPTAPPIGPLEENDSAQQTYSASDIRGMSMNDYVKNRDRLLGAVRKKVQDGGIYG